MISARNRPACLRLDRGLHQAGHLYHHRCRWDPQGLRCDGDGDGSAWEYGHELYRFTWFDMDVASGRERLASDDELRAAGATIENDLSGGTQQINAAGAEIRVTK